MVVPQFLFGIPGDVFLVFISAFFYIVSIFLLRSYRQEYDELLNAFLAFMVGMAVFHIALGIGLYLNNSSIIYIGLFSALTGATFTLKFVLTHFSETKRAALFYICLAVVWTAFLGALVFSTSTATILLATFWYMIFTTGILVGIYIIFRGIISHDAPTRVKSIGGGLGMITCCLIADISAITAGVTILGELFMSVAPLIILGSIYYGRKLERVAERASDTRHVAL